MALQSTRSFEARPSTLINMETTDEPSSEAKAYELMLKSRSLSVVNNTFNQDAFDLLSKAIKLNPHLIEAWVEMTNCYQRKLDIDGAIACLENALKYCSPDKPNKILLRKLSTCIRQKNCSSQEAKVAALLRSLELSKQALKSDLYDEENYYNLAKAYMCLFFITECSDRQLIYLSKAAYSKALNLSNETSSRNQKATIQQATLEQCSQKINMNNSSTTTTDPESEKSFMEQSDFLFNYSTVLVYLQEFKTALEFLKLAVKLDPDWPEPRLLEECLVDYLKQIYLMLNELHRSNKKVVRRYNKIVESLNAVSRIEEMILADQQRLIRSNDVTLDSVTLDQLEQATNQLTKEPQSERVKLIHLKLLNTINYNQAMYLTFIAMDRNYSVIVVTIYNLAASKCPTPRDIVTLVDPVVEEVEVTNVCGCAGTGKELSVNFKRIDVREFRQIYVNGQRICTDQVSRPQFRVSMLP